MHARRQRAKGAHPQLVERPPTAAHPRRGPWTPPDPRVIGEPEWSLRKECLKVSQSQGISISEFARRDGCDRKVVYRAIERGTLIPFADKTLPPELVGTGWRQGNRDLRPGETPQEAATRLMGVPGEAVDMGDPSTWSRSYSEQVKEAYLALLRKMEFDHRSGRLVHVETVAAQVATEYSRVRSRLLAIPTTIAPRLAGIDRPTEIADLIQAEIVGALEALTMDDPEEADPRVRHH